jgi:hypothetical protein
LFFTALFVCLWGQTPTELQTKLEFERQLWSQFTKAKCPTKTIEKLLCWFDPYLSVTELLDDISNGSSPLEGLHFSAPFFLSDLRF